MIQLTDIKALSSHHIQRLKKRGIFTSDDLLVFYPKNYFFLEDYLPKNRTNKSDTITEIVKLSSTYTGNKVFIANCSTLDGRKITVSFFGKSRYAFQFIIGETYLVFGPASIYNEQLQITSPLYFAKYIEGNPIPVYTKYPEIKGVSEKVLKQAITEALKNIDNADYLSEEIVKNAKLCSRYRALQTIHFPLKENELKAAKRRIVFDILFKFKFTLYSSQLIKYKYKEEMNKRSLTRSIIKKLPYSLTKTKYELFDNLGQFEAVKIISKKLENREVLNLLIQGDVGSGKTIIALISAMMFIENNKKAAIFLPTQILAQQMYEEAIRLYGDTAKVELYTGATKNKDKRLIQQKILKDECDLLIGSYSINNLKIPNLGLLIVDEEHRFGVTQKEFLANTSTEVSYISMSATPIPRTIAQSIYGNNMDILSITRAPSGRKPIITSILQYNNTFFTYLLNEVKKGHQGYIVCPIIQENEKSKKRSIEEVYNDANYFFSPYGVKIKIINGSMQEDLINQTLQDFKDKKFSILISTTIIEVGVNVPNATIIGIVNAEYFGLAQLHQLRGRVGRSSLQSYCYLLSDIHSERLEYMTHSNSGFELAKKDLQMRGVGELFGEAQTGLSLAVEIMLANEKMDKYIDSILRDMPTSEIERYKKYFKI